MEKEVDNPIFVALDHRCLDDALATADELKSVVGGFKVGLELFFGYGVKVYEEVAKTRLPVFLDLKVHDIPTTVRKSVIALLDQIQEQPFCFSVHGSGREEMVNAAVKARDDVGSTTKILSVAGLSSNPDDLVLQSATYADGVICPPGKSSIVKSLCGNEALVVSPGIRRASDETNDHHAPLSIKETTSIDIFVIGRPITMAEHPAKEAKAFVQEEGA